MPSDFDTEVLIREVERRTHLWDSSHEEYKNREIRLKAWQEISANVVPGIKSLNEAEQKKCAEKVQKRWKTARDAYFKSRNKMNQKKSGSAAANIPKYIYHDQLAFLDRLRESPTESNFGPQSVLKDIDNDDDQPTEDEPSQLEIDDVRPNLSTKKHVFNRKKPTRNSAFENYLLTLLKDSKEKGEDDDRAFLTSLLPSLKTLNQDQKLIFRSQVLQLIMTLKGGNQAI